MALLQLVETTCSKAVDNKIRQSTCNRLLSSTKLSKAKQMHPDISYLDNVGPPPRLLQCFAISPSFIKIMPCLKLTIISI